MSTPIVYASPRDLLGEDGKQLATTDWFAVEQDRIDQFADATEDHQWIHVDVERAKDGPFGATIAHGFLTLSLANVFLPQMIDVRGFAHAVNVGCDRIRFIAPVPAGSRIRGSGEIVSVVEKKGGIESIVRITIEVEGGDKPACIVDTISRYYPES